MNNLGNKILLFIAFFSIIASYTYFSNMHKKYQSISSYETCVAAGFEIVHTYPETCKMAGKFFINPNQVQKEVADVATSTENLDENNFKNLSYIIDGQSVQLKNGEGILSSNYLLKRSTTTISVTDRSFVFDINGDLKNDYVFMLNTKEKNLYYLTASVSLNTGYVGINGVYISENISTSTFGYKNGEIVLTFVNKNSNQKQEKKFIFENDILKEVTLK